jgi:uncharacterized membrane protein YheB (UPF0754 family)
VNTWVIVVLLSVVGAVIGYTTKWAAIQMLFKPAHYIGIGPVGWQGVIQRRSPKFAAGIADTVTGSALDVHELIEGIDADEVAGMVTPTIDAAAPSLAATVAEVVSPGAWASVPQDVQDRTATALAQRVRLALVDVIEGAKPELAGALDPRGLIVSLLSGENADRLARLVQDVAAAELRWVIRFGAVCGLVIGALEAVVYLQFDRWWLLPLVGALDGIVNNWLAIYMMFRPLERKRILGLVSYQGLFAARQPEIAANYARMMGEEVLTPRNLMERLGEQGALATLGASALAAAQPRLEEGIAVVAGTLHAELTAAQRMAAVAALVPNMLGAIAPAADDIEDQLAKQLDITRQLEERLTAMDKVQFETVLRSIFQEDEWILIALGGVLGAAIGTLQAGLVLATGIAG